MNEVRIFYDEQYDEWGRFDRHPIEFDVTKAYLDRYLPPAPSCILDIGGGPGRYSLYLAGKGHAVTLFDLSGRHVNEALQRAAAAGLALAGAVQGDALELDGVGEEPYDAVLLMGPLYHLTEEADRRRAVERALAVLRPGGVLFASFISAYALLRGHLADPASAPGAQAMLEEMGAGNYDGAAGFTTSWYCTPQQARALMKPFPLEELALAGVENIVGTIEPQLPGLPENQRADWLKLAQALAEDPNLYGYSTHYLYVGRKADDARC